MLTCTAFLLLLGACTTLGNPRRDAVVAEAEAQGFRARDVAAGPFTLLALIRLRHVPVARVTVYLEGDGAPWPNAFQAPRDPTPLYPTVLRMAEADGDAAVVYLGRPCQYLAAAALRGCDPAWRDERRYDAEVVAAYAGVLDRIKAEAGAVELRLIGYSGGGVLAALLAGQRDDARQWLTVAAPLDLQRWLTAHAASPMPGSIDPISQVTRHPGVHWAAERDTVVAAEIVASYVGQRGGSLHLQPGFDHDCCWARDWARLLKESWQ